MRHSITAVLRIARTRQGQLAAVCQRSVYHSSAQGEMSRISHWPSLAITPKSLFINVIGDTPTALEKMCFSKSSLGSVVGAHAFSGRAINAYSGVYIVSPYALLKLRLEFS
jgi:hypothetical protein